MENILKNIPKQEIGKLQAARARADRLKGQLADRENGIADTRRKLSGMDEKIRDIIADGGNPASVTTEKSRLSRELEADELLLETYKEAVNDAERELTEATRKADGLLTQAVFTEQQCRQSQYQKQIDAIEAGLREYRAGVYSAAESMGLAGPLILPAIKLRADYLLDALR